MKRSIFYLLLVFLTIHPGHSEDNPENQVSLKLSSSTETIRLTQGIGEDPFFGADESDVYEAHEVSKNGNGYTEAEKMRSLKFDPEFNPILHQIKTQYEIPGIIDRYKSAYEYLHILMKNALAYYFDRADQAFSESSNSETLLRLQTSTLNILSSSEPLVILSSTASGTSNTASFYDCESFMVQPFLDFIGGKYRQLGKLETTKNLNPTQKSHLKASGTQESTAQFQSAWYLLMTWSMTHREIQNGFQKYLEILIQQADFDHKKREVQGILEAALSSIQEQETYSIQYTCYHQDSEIQSQKAQTLKSELEKTIQEYTSSLRQPNDPEQKSWMSMMWNAAYKGWYHSHPRSDKIKSTINPFIKSEDVAWAYERLEKAFRNHNIEGLDMITLLYVPQPSLEFFPSIETKEDLED